MKRPRNFRCGVMFTPRHPTKARKKTRWADCLKWGHEPPTKTREPRPCANLVFVEGDKCHAHQGHTRKERWLRYLREYLKTPDYRVVAEKCHVGLGTVKIGVEYEMDRAGITQEEFTDIRRGKLVMSWDEYLSKRKDYEEKRRLQEEAWRRKDEMA